LGLIRSASRMSTSLSSLYHRYGESHLATHLEDRPRYHFVQLHHMRRRASSSHGKTQIHPQGIPQDPTGMPQDPTGIPQDPTGIPPGSGAIWGDNECAPIVRRPDPDYLYCSAQFTSSDGIKEEGSGARKQ